MLVVGGFPARMTSFVFDPKFYINQPNFNVIRKKYYEL